MHIVLVCYMYFNMDRFRMIENKHVAFKELKYNMIVFQSVVSLIKMLMVYTYGTLYYPN